jgi:hypothetical protein
LDPTESSPPNEVAQFKHNSLRPNWLFGKAVMNWRKTMNDKNWEGMTIKVHQALVKIGKQIYVFISTNDICIKINVGPDHIHQDSHGRLHYCSLQILSHQ